MRQVASISLNVRAEQCLDGKMIYVSVSSHPGSEWMGTEEQFVKMFAAGGSDREVQVNNIADLLQALWKSALARNLEAEKPGLLRPSFLRRLATPIVR